MPVVAVAATASCRAFDPGVVVATAYHQVLEVEVWPLTTRTQGLWTTWKRGRCLHASCCTTHVGHVGHGCCQRFKSRPCVPSCPSCPSRPDAEVADVGSSNNPCKRVFLPHCTHVPTVGNYKSLTHYSALPRARCDHRKLTTLWQHLAAGADCSSSSVCF